MSEFVNPVAAMSSEPLFSPTAVSNSSTGSLRRVGSGNDEFFGNQEVCPTCRGAGRISRETNQQIMALIPLGDKRLRPRRTLLYVLLAVAICLTIGGLILFFFFPRSVDLTSNQPTLQPTNIYINVSAGVLSMTVTNYFNLTNQNFFSVDVVSLDVFMYFDQHILASETNHTEMRLPMRSTRLHYMTMNVTFGSDQFYIIRACNSVEGMMLLIPFRTTVKLEYLGKTEQNSLQTYQYVHCNADHDW